MERNVLRKKQQLTDTCNYTRNIYKTVYKHTTCYSKLHTLQGITVKKMSKKQTDENCKRLKELFY